MKRIIIYCMILGAVCLIPVQKQDVATLEPIQAVWMSEENGAVVLKTDTDDVGEGENVQEALENMKDKSTGVVYLDTAQYLLVTEKAKHRIPEIAGYLKGSVRVCSWEGKGELVDAARYMQARKLGIRLRKWQEKSILPTVPDLNEKNVDFLKNNA